MPHLPRPTRNRGLSQAILRRIQPPPSLYPSAVSVSSHGPLAQERTD